MDSTPRSEPVAPWLTEDDYTGQYACEHAEAIASSACCGAIRRLMREHGVDAQAFVAAVRENGVSEFDAWVARKRNRSLRTGDSYPMRDLIQLDGWASHPPGDDIMRPDEDGVVRMGGRTREPQVSDTTVRMYIDPDADRDDVLQVIRKQLAWLEKDDGPLSPGWQVVDPSDPDPF